MRDPTPWPFVNFPTPLHTSGPDAALNYLADQHFGVIGTDHIRRLGLSTQLARSRIRSGLWRQLGHHTYRVLASEWHPTKSLIVAARIEAGRHAWVDGESALIMCDLTGYESRDIHISAPRGTRPKAGLRIRVHSLKLAPPFCANPTLIACPEVAVLRAAAWARTDRQAALLIAMTFEQRLAQAEPTWQALDLLPRLRRRQLIRGVLTDVVGGAESMGELDFAAMCRVRGIPLPARQVLKRGATGRMFLDAYWPAAHLVAEIDGAHHYVGDTPTSGCTPSERVSSCRGYRHPDTPHRIADEP